VLPSCWNLKLLAGVVLAGFCAVKNVLTGMMVHYQQHHHQHSDMMTMMMMMMILFGKQA